MTGRRERKKRTTHDSLHRVGLELFDRQGYSDTTVAQICERADYSTRTFFRYFPSKSDVFGADQPARIAALRAVLGGRPPDEPVVEGLRAALLYLADDLGEHADVLLAQARIATREPELRSGLDAHHLLLQHQLVGFVAGRLDGRDPTGVLAHAVAAGAFGAYCDQVRPWVLGGGDGPFAFPLDDIIATVAALLQP